MFFIIFLDSGVICLVCLQWDGVLFIWVSPTILILSQGDVGELMGRNGDAQEMQLLIRSTVSDT